MDCPGKEKLADIFEFLAEVSEIVAEKITNGILEKSKTLGQFAEIGQIEPLLKSRKNGYRYLVEGNYKIIYNRQEGNVIIHLVFDTRQNPKKLKKSLK